MNYSLGNMLGGAGALNADKLSLDLQFAADKTLTARKGPTPTFTRASGATFVNNLGQVKYARENLVLQSEDFGNVSWSKTQINVSTNTAISPNGLNTADSLIENTANALRYVSQQTTKSGGFGTYLFSVYYKNAIGTRNLTVALTNGVSSGRGAIFTTSGTVAASNIAIGTGSGFTMTSSTVTSVGDGWYRASIIVDTDTSTRLDAVVYLNESTTNIISYTGDGVSSIFVWGAQLERHEFARAYIPTTTAAVYQPRFDHDPVTLACKGLLIEEARTNLTLQSSTSTGWTTASATQTNNNTTSPDGSTNATRVVATSASFVSHALQSASTTISVGVSHSCSIYVKQGVQRYVYVTYVNFTGNEFHSACIVDLETGSITQTKIGTSATSGSASISSAGNGWYRVVIPNVVLTGITAAFVEVGSSQSGTGLGNFGRPTTAFAGDTSSHWFVWGGQIEAGSFPTSYIPTLAASVVRSADVCSIDGSNFSSIWNGVDATVFFRGSRIAAQTGQNSWSLSSSTLATNINLNRGATTENIGAAGAAIIFSTGISGSSEYKVATAIKSGDYAASFNGAAALTSSNAFVLTLNKMNIGTNYPLNGQLNGWIHSIKFYKKRLSNAKITQLTT